MQLKNIVFNKEKQTAHILHLNALIIGQKYKQIWKCYIILNTIKSNMYNTKAYFIIIIGHFRKNLRYHSIIFSPFSRATRAYWWVRFNTFAVKLERGGLNFPLFVFLDSDHVFLSFSESIPLWIVMSENKEKAELWPSTDLEVIGFHPARTYFFLMIWENWNRFSLTVEV